MLRSRLERNNVDGGYQQRITEDVSGSYRWRAHDGVSQNRIDAAVAESQSSMNAFVGPVFAVDLFHENGVNTLLSLVSHHMVVDIVSWRIILEDLEDLLLNPDQPVSQNGSLPFQTWCRLQAEQCRPSDSRTMEELPETPEPNYSYWGLQHKQTTYPSASGCLRRGMSQVACPAEGLRVSMNRLSQPPRRIGFIHASMRLMLTFCPLIDGVAPEEHAEQ